MSEIKVPVSPGEMLDKITILRIKSKRMSDAQKLANVRLELRALEETWSGSAYSKIPLSAEVDALYSVNERLWVIEDDIRDKERAQAFDAEFIRLARAVYFENDERAAIKKRINLKLGSAIVEEKSYSEYKSTGRPPTCCRRGRPRCDSRCTRRRSRNTSPSPRLRLPGKPADANSTASSPAWGMKAASRLY
jgi:hypothetical protein